MPSAEQNVEQLSDQRKPWLIPAGTDGRAYLLRRKREVIEAKARKLAGEIGGFDNLPPFKRALLLQAAELLIQKKPDVVRTANALGRIYSSLGLSALKGRRLMRLPAK